MIIKSLKKVVLYADIHAACLQHALTSEKEEIMGLLIGEVRVTVSLYHLTIISNENF